MYIDNSDKALWNDLDWQGYEINQQIRTVSWT